jgi:hypothetical protein
MTEVRGFPIAAEEIARALRDGHLLSIFQRYVSRTAQPRKVRRDFQRLLTAYDAWLAEQAGRKEDGS